MDHTTFIIATLSRPELNLWVNGSIATMIAGAIFFLFGVFIGWWIWKNTRIESLEVAKVNKELVSDYKQRNKNFEQLTERLAPVSKKVDLLN